MIISARFASRCRRCGSSIHTGDSIAWTRGLPAVHEKCGASGDAPARRRDGGYVRDPGEDAAERWAETQRSGYAGRYLAGELD